PDGDAIVYDALVDPDLAMDVLHLVAPEVEASVPRPLVLEQANSSVVFDEALIMKVFRRVGGGSNPDAEIPRVLADRGFTHVLSPLAELRREGCDLAVLRPFMVGAMSAWQLARTSMRDVLADRQPPEDAGADFAPDAERIGTVIGELHVQLAEAFGVEPGDGPAWAEAMVERLGDVDGRGPVELPPEVDRDQVIATYREMLDIPDVGPGIRVHGNLHLDQLIKADAGWTVLDFEGVPERRVVSPSGRSSVLRDVAGR